MDDLFAFLERAAPYLMLLALLAVIVAAIRVHGHLLDKHAEWLRQLDLRVGNLHEDRKARHAQSLQLPREPPPLSEARTLEVSEDLLLTMRRDPKARKDGPH